MFKHLIIAIYISSAMYCYWQLGATIDSCIDLFKERHPSLPIDGAKFWPGLKFGIEVMALCAIPVLNLLFGYFCATLDHSVIIKIVENVETDHWKEIKEYENEFNSVAEELDGSD